MRRSVVCSPLLILTALLVAACSQAASTQGPTTWLDDPLDGANLPLGPTEIVAHASDPDGIASFDVYVNGALLAHAQAVASAPVRIESTGYSGAPGTAGYLASATVGWHPTTPGVYTISAMASDSQGNSGPDATAVVTVGEVEASPTPTLVPTGEMVTGETPSPVPPAVSPMVATWTPLPPGMTPMVPTWTPKPPTITPMPPARRPEIAYFEANPSTIGQGGCSTIKWGVDYAAEVYLDGQGVTDHDTYQVCPPSTTSYTLYARSPGGEQSASVTVTVIHIQPATPTPKVSIITPEPIEITPEPVDNTKPTISDITLSQSKLHTYPDNCGTGCPCTLTISARVTDESGVWAVVATLHLAGASKGSRIMNQSAPDVYEAELGPFAEAGELVITIVAQDWHANTAEEVLFPITVWNSCIG